MENIIGTISLLWVVGVLTLQRLDNEQLDYYDATRFYLAIKEGEEAAVDTIQLDLLKKGANSTIDQVLKLRLNSEKSEHKSHVAAIIRTLKFSKNLKNIYTYSLVGISLVLPLLSRVNFADWPGSGLFTKLDAVYILILLFFIESLAAVEIVRYKFRTFYPTGRYH